MESDKNNLLISVIIPTYNRNDLLEKCLINLNPRKQTIDSSLYEVIVTDDSKEKKAERFIKDNFPWVKWIEGAHKGPSANRNNGAKFSAGQWLLFVDDDCIPDLNIIEEYIKAIKTYTEYEVFEGRTYVDAPRRSLAEISPINETGGYLWSCNFCIKKTLFEKLQGFDERFPYACMEDVDLRYRIIKSGYSFKFIKEASVCHPWRYKINKTGGWKKLENIRKSMLIYLDLHPDEKKRINSFYYLNVIIRSLIKETIPGILKYRGAGLKTAIQEHLSSLKMALILLKK